MARAAWAVEMLEVVRPNVPLDVNIKDLDQEGMFLLHHTSQQVLTALARAGFTNMVGRDGSQWVFSRESKLRGLMFFPCPDDEDCDVWGFFDHSDRRDASLRR